MALGLIEEESDAIAEETQTNIGFSYVADEEHHTEAFRRMTEVKQSLKIATANLKSSANITSAAIGKRA